MFKQKIDILAALKEAGYTQYKLRTDKIMGSRAMTDLKAGNIPGIVTLDTICNILDCQLSDIITHVPDSDNDSNDGTNTD